VEYNLSGAWPVCKCGCEQKVKWSNELKGFTTYVKGHYSRVHNNWGHNQKAIDASSKTRRAQFDSGERTVWNVGLTKDTDDRVKRNGDKASDGIMSSDVERNNRSKKMKAQWESKNIVPLYGKDSSRWQGGVSSINQIARASTVLYKEWKYPILVRDGFKCTQCPNTKDLHVHHNKESFSEIIKKVMTFDDFEKLEEFNRKKEVADKVVAYHVDNEVDGVTLCKECHNVLHPSLNF
jgi:hypothetical protein